MEPILGVNNEKNNLSMRNELCYKNQEENTLKMVPKIVPLYDGHELKIKQKLINNGLATISVRNMKSKEFAIKERNSFFNLHRPELKGLNIVYTKTQQEKMLHQNILKEVKTIHKINSMKSYKIDKPQSLLLNSQTNIMENINTKLQELTLENDKFHKNDMEVKSTLIN